MSHKFLQFQAPPPKQRIVREVALSIFNAYTKQNLSRSNALKQKGIQIRWQSEKHNPTTKKKEPISIISNNFSVSDFETHLEQRNFEHNQFQLYEMKSHWLDSSITISPNFHFVDQKGDVVKIAIPTELGQSFPLTPTLDREGTSYNSFQSLLLNRIISLTDTLVDQSDNFSQEHWFQLLRSFFSECVSIVDNSLHQLYFKAKHSPEPNWKFDEASLGPRHGIRLTDKISWIYKITGNHLNATNEINAFIKLKDLRNHLNHFDPPCFCFTLEEVADWLNLAQNLSVLLWKMRIAMGAPLSEPLIRLLLMKKIKFIPQNSSKRLPMNPSTGYSTTRW